jgi:hypothetical protein
MTLIRQIKNTVLILVTILVAGCGGGGGAPSIDTPPHLVEAMKAKYDGKWYKTLTFTQETIQYRSGVADTSIWYEALSLPGKLRIDIAPTESGNGLLFKSDKRYVFRADTLLLERDEIHPLMVLGFDAYVQKPQVTLTQLDSLGFDLTVLSEAEWNRRPVYVVGAHAGDLRTSQIWIDKELLVLVRVIQKGGIGNQNLVDIRFRDFQTVGGGWVASTVEFYLDGTLSILEYYSDIVVDRELSPDLFEPDAWDTATHWMSEAGDAEDAGP